MNSLVPRRFAQRLSLAVALGLAGSALGQEETTPEAATPERSSSSSITRLVITNGTFVRDGKPVPATLGNIVNFMKRRFPDVSITLVGVETITIDNLTLQWPRRVKVLPPIDPDGPLLESTFVALAEASGRKFKSVGFGPGDFVLSPVEASAPPRRGFEVFSLGSKRSSGEHLDAALRELETELAVLQKRFTNDHPQVRNVVTRIEVLKEQKMSLSPSSRTAQKLADKLLQEIQRTVPEILRHLDPRAQAPTFQFHESSQLLVVIGSDEAIDVTRKVIAALEKNPD